MAEVLHAGGAIADARPVAARSIRANALWTLAGNLAYGACQWAMVVVIARIGTPVMVGHFALAFAITAPIILAANLKLRAVLATDARREYSFGDYLGLRLATLAIANAVILAWVALLYRSEAGLVIAVVGLAKSVESTSQVFFGFMQQHERLDWISRSMILKGVLSVVALYAGLRLGGSVRWGVVGLAVAWAAVLVGYDIRNAARLARAHGGARLTPRWRWDVQWSLARTTIPLGVAGLLASLQTNVPRLFVERLLGARELGFFAASGYLVIVGARFMTSLGDAVAPRLAAYHAGGDRARFLRLLAQLLAVVAGIALVGIAVAFTLGDLVLASLYRPEYAGYARVLAVLMLAAGLEYVAIALQYALTAARVLRAQAVIVGAAFAATAVACALLVPAYGSVGAAAATCAGAAIHLAANALAVRAALQPARSS